MSDGGVGRPFQTALGEIIYIDVGLVTLDLRW
jgi:hypothetical protein